MSVNRSLPQPAPALKAAQKLVLLGAGSAHLRVLAALAAKPLPHTQVTLVAAQLHTLPDPLLPGFVAGQKRLEECTIPVKQLVDRSGVCWMQLGISRLDAARQTVLLSDGSALAYDWLSIAHVPACNREEVERVLPGAREHAVFVHPVEHFAALWPKVAALGDQRPLRLAVMGSDTQAIEIAMAVRHRLPHAAVTLLCGSEPLATDFPAPVRPHLLAALKKRGVTVLQDHALAIHADTLALGCGAGLACDGVLLADRAELPAWLTTSGLAMVKNKDLAVDAGLRSTSHSKVFGIRTSDASSRTGALLVRNLRAALADKPLRSLSPWTTPLQLLSCGDRCGIATWGNYSTEGRWVWWLKNWMDRRRIAACTVSSKS